MPETRTLQLEQGETKRVADITNTVVREAQSLSPNGRKALVICFLRRFADVVDAMKHEKKEGGGECIKS